MKQEGWTFHLESLNPADKFYQKQLDKLAVVSGQHVHIIRGTEK